MYIIVDQHSFIQDTTGTGNLYIDSNSLQIRNAAGDETQATFAENGGSCISLL